MSNFTCLSGIKSSDGHIRSDFACIPHGYQPTESEPDNQNFIERDLYNTNPLDHDWRTKNQYFSDLPLYLLKYFANRYKQIFKSKGRAAANKFLRERMEPARDRVRAVLRQYDKLPTTRKMILLSEQYDDIEQSDFSPQTKFDFEQAARHSKPVRNRIIAELEPDEIKEMAFRISQLMNVRFQSIAAKVASYDKETIRKIVKRLPKGYRYFPEVEGYNQLAEFAKSFGINPPQKYKKQSALSATQDISKILSEKWWQGQLTRIRKIMREHLAIAMGQVSAKASPYASWDCVKEYKEQQKRNWNYIKQCQLFDEETGEEADLSDMVLKSVSNPAIRRHELMVRCRGCEDIGNELELQGLFLTLTTPSRYHNHYKKGGFISHWNGASPKAGQSYLNHVWQCIRAKLGRDEIRWFGVRVAEPHHDGTPHWHLLIWVKPEDVDAVRRIFILYAVAEDKEELYPKSNLPGPFNYKPRCDFGFIDPEKGTATGYIAKYISKNIDGYAMDHEISDETGKPVQEMARNVSAWKSRWNIRQFQFFGGAPVTTYRELRRFASQNKKAFMEYVFMQERSDLIGMYYMLNYRLTGPVKPARLMTNLELVEVISENFEARIKTDEASIAGTMKAADHGNWRGYIMGQGGPFVKRDDLLITNVYQELPFASPHGETVRKIDGFQTPESIIQTRLRVWTIRKKIDKSEASAGSEATQSGGSAASWSSVNNCTEPAGEQISDQLKRVFEPDKIQSEMPPDMQNALVEGRTVQIDDNRMMKIRPAEVDEHGNVRQAQLIEVTVSDNSDDSIWLDFEGFDKLDKLLPSNAISDEYHQPELSPFVDDEWPLL